VDDLAKAGVSAATIKKITPLVTMSGGGAAASTDKPAKAPSKRSSAASSAKEMAPAAPSGGAVDLNSASEKDLENLPGVGPAAAKKIIAGRPYSSVDGLAKAGVSAATVKKISPLVTVSGGGAAASMPAPASAPSKKSSSAASAKAAAPAAPTGAAVDLNSASEKDLVDLPGVGPATAKKIIAGRPYSSVDGLAKAGVSAATIKKITPLVMVSGGGAAASTPPSSPMPSKKSSSTTGYTGAPPASSSMPSTAPASQPAPAPAPTKSAPSGASQGTPGPGTVWVNLDSGIYHYPGTRYYGKTKSGKYMPEADAVKAGYHAAENEKKPQ
jgi:DNA uptake protein ComE-like DNA-binding protein